MRTFLAGICVIAVTAGCSAPLGKSEDHHSASQPSASASPTPTPTPTADPFAPNVGARGLKMGQTRHGHDVDTTLLAVQQPATAPSYIDPDNKGDEWITAKVRECIHDKISSPFTIGAYDFIGMDRDGGQYDVAGSSWDAWPPLPQFPDERRATPGACVVGWVLFEVPGGQRFNRVGLVGGDEQELVAEWRL